MLKEYDQNLNIFGSVWVEVSRIISIAKWLRHPLWEREVEGSNPSVGGSGFHSDMDRAA